MLPSSDDYKNIITFVEVMDKSWRKIKICIGCELKTIQQLNALGIRNKLPLKNIIVNGIMYEQLEENGCAWAFMNETDEQAILELPFVLSIE